MSSIENSFYSDDEEYIALEESFNENESQTENEHYSIEFPGGSKTYKTSRKRKKSLSDLKAPRGKFSLRWEKDFPWVRADNIDESLGVCTVCDKQLVCKRSHLERHEKSYKHQRFLAGIHKKDRKKSHTENESDIRICLSEEETNEMDSIEIDPYFASDIETKNLNDVRTDISSTIEIGSDYLNSEETINSKAQVGREKILNRINRSRAGLNDFYSRLKSKSHATQSLIVAPSRDSFDLFFDSVSATVKTLPPKLAAEVKSQVSQLIAEFELRAIYEREAALVSAESLLSYEVVPKVQHVTSTTTIEGTGAQIVYTLPIKQPTLDYEQQPNVAATI